MFAQSLVMKNDTSCFVICLNMVEYYGQFDITHICCSVDCLEVKITSAELLYTDIQVTSPTTTTPSPSKKVDEWEFISKIPEAASQPFPYYLVT